MVMVAAPDLRVIIPGDPVAQGRGRATSVGGRARIYDPPKSRTWKAHAAAHMRRAMETHAPLDGALDGALACSVLFVFMRSKPLVDRRWKDTKPDADNLAKAVLDAGNGVLWTDDGQVVEITIRKVWGGRHESARVELEAWRLD